MRKIFLDTTSRYKETNLFSEQDKTNKAENTFFGTFIPREITLSDENDTFVTLRESEIGRLDLIAKTYYGDERLWWVIALVNDIGDPMFGIEAGTVLRIPSLDGIF